MNECLNYATGDQPNM